MERQHIYEHTSIYASQSLINDAIDYMFDASDNYHHTLEHVNQLATYYRPNRISQQDYQDYLNNGIDYDCHQC